MRPAASVAALAAENRIVKARLRALTSEVVRNQSILQKSQERELELLRAASLGDLLKILFHDLKASYQLEAVVLALCDPAHEIRHLLWGDPIVEQHRGEVLFVDRLAQLAPMAEGLGQPWLGRYREKLHAGLFPGVKGLGSVAIIPMRQHDAIEGVLMFGSADKSEGMKAFLEKREAKWQHK